MPRLAALLAALLLAACSQPVDTGFRGFTGFGGATADPVPAGPRGERDPRYDACREEATRAVQWRDRGQLMRTDETESGRGTVTVAPFSRTEADRMGAQMERDRLIAECLRRPVAGGGATPR